MKYFSFLMNLLYIVFKSRVKYCEMLQVAVEAFMAMRWDYINHLEKMFLMGGKLFHSLLFGSSS